MPKRPSNAWWSVEDDEWVLGDKDEQGRLTGLVRYWNKAEVFISDCEHREGKPHGRARRVYSDGSIEQECRYVDGVITGARRIHRPQSDDIEALGQFERLHDAVAFYECVYEGGDLIGTLTRDVEGKQIDAHDGEPVPERPPGVPATASPFQDGWLFMRRKGEDGTETLETREYYADGTLKSEDLPDGTDRSFHSSGALESEGMRVQHKEHGWWRYGDADGVIRRESRFELGVECARSWHRTAKEAGGEAVKAEGPVTVLEQGELESGEWQFVGDGVSQIVRFGEPENEDALLRGPWLQENAPDAALEAALGLAGPAARLARVRLAGRRKEDALLEGAVSTGPAWLRFSCYGELLDEDDLPHLVNALLFQKPMESLGRLAAWFFAKDRPKVALDIVDAALCIPAGEGVDLKTLRLARVSYLRALGEDQLAATAIREIHNGRDFDTEAALLLRLRAEPTDTSLRREFATLISDTEPDHAALIRLDHDGGTAEERRKLLHRIRSTLPETIADATDAIEGGFFELGDLYLRGEDFLEHHEALFRWAPFTKCLNLSFASAQVAQLAVLPSLRRYTTLNFWEALLFDGRAAQLARSPHLAQLEVLGLFDSSLYDEELVAILRSTSYPVLRELDISSHGSGQHYTFEGFKMLAESVFASTLEVLRINGHYFVEDITPVLEALPRLHHLELSGHFGDWGNDALQRLARLERAWTTLKLDRCGIGSAGVKEFVKSDGLKALSSLTIGGNRLGEKGLNMLLASPLSNLKELSVEGNECGVGEAFGKAMQRAPMAASLEDLNLSLAQLGPAGAVALSRAPLTALRRLNLHLNGVGDIGVKAIASSANLGELRFLDVSQNGVTDEGGKALASSPHLQHLERLELGGAELSDSVKEALKSRFGAHVYFEYSWNRR